MRTKRPANLEVIGMDGWAALAPGASVTFTEDCAPSPGFGEQRHRMRQVRGSILSGGFDIENEIHMLTLSDQFGTLDPAIAGPEFKSRLKAMRNDSRLERKIEAAKAVVRGMLPSGHANRVMQDLAEYRRVRHLMAHQPCWLEGVWDAEAGTLPDLPKGRTVGYRLFIADSDFVWEVDDGQIQEWMRLMSRCAATLDALKRRRLGISEPGSFGPSRSYDGLPAPF